MSRKIPPDMQGQTSLMARGYARPCRRARGCQALAGLHPAYMLPSACSQSLFPKTKIIIGAFASFVLLGWVTSVYCLSPRCLCSRAAGDGLCQRADAGRGRRVWTCRMRRAACSRLHVWPETVGKIQPKLCFDRGLGFLCSPSNSCIIVIIITNSIIIIILYWNTRQQTH